MAMIEMNRLKAAPEDSTEAARDVLSGNSRITKDNLGTVLDYVRLNPTHENVLAGAKALLSYVQDSKDAIMADADIPGQVKSALPFFRQAIVSLLALDVYEKTVESVTGKSDYRFFDLYGKYIPGSNDCFSMMMKLYWQYQNIFAGLVPAAEPFALDKPVFNKFQPEMEGDKIAVQGVNLYAAGKISLHLGDIVMVDYDANTGTTSHYGMVVDDGGELKIVSRGYDGKYGIEPEKKSLADFLKNTRGYITITSYGAPPYSQCFDVAITKNFNGSLSYSVSLADAGGAFLQKK